MSCLDCSTLIDPLDSATAGLQSHEKVTLDDCLLNNFQIAQQTLKSTKSITVPRPPNTLWIVANGSLKKRGLGATLYVLTEKHLLAGFFSAKLCKHQVTWLPCEIEALSIAVTIKHISPYITQSHHHTYVLTDSKPYVQALD